MANTRDEALEMLAAIQQFSLQRCLEFAVAVEEAQAEGNELGYNRYQAKYYKWLTIQTQIDCAIALINID